MSRHIDRDRVRAPRIEGASRRVVDQVRRAEKDQPDALELWGHELPELAAAVQALAAILEDDPEVLG